MYTATDEYAQRRPNEALPLFGTAAILAGGKSSRMGFDKQLLTENNRRILENVVCTLKAEFPDVIVVTASPELYADMDVRVFRDEYPGKGPLAGIHAALRNARSRYVYLLACDMPVVCTGFVRHMAASLRRSRAEICVSEHGGRIEPFNAFYSISLLPRVVQRLESDDSSLYRFIHSANASVIPQEDAVRFDAQLRMFTNINTPDEYAAYLGR